MAKAAVINRLRSDPFGILGAFIYAAIAVFAYRRWDVTGSLFYVLLGFRDLVLCALFLTRAPATHQGSALSFAVAYVSASLPLAYSAEGFGSGAKLGADVLFVLGFALATIASLELGKSMGVAPAVRDSRKNTGVYRVLRHPMYAGYAIAEIGWVLLSFKNLPLFLVSMLFYFVRARFEERLLSRSA